MYSEALGEEVAPMLMENSPPALATGERCWEKGWHFIWMGHKKPLLITPEGRFIKHEVRDCLPWIKEASAHSVEALTTDPEWPVGLTTTDRDGNVRPETEGLGNTIDRTRDVAEALLKAGATPMETQ